MIMYFRPLLSICIFFAFQSCSVVEDSKTNVKLEAEIQLVSPNGSGVEIGNKNFYTEGFWNNDKLIIESSMTDYEGESKVIYLEIRNLFIDGLGYYKISNFPFSEGILNVVEKDTIGHYNTSYDNSILPFPYRHLRGGELRITRMESNLVSGTISFIAFRYSNRVNRVVGWGVQCSFKNLPFKLK